MADQTSFNLSTNSTGPVECLGQTFPSDQARRDHYLQLLAEKLKSPDFRKTAGFPVGDDAAILALSDPPYYCACPNPWTSDFTKCYGKPYDSKKRYHREPFAADVSEGKNHPIYGAHAYHTKVPHRAIMRYILHYTQPGDIVLDGFSGTGMTGVAARLCGDRSEILGMGYRITEKGDILNEEGAVVSKLGERRAILNDLSPAATFIAHNYNSAVDEAQFESESNRILRDVNASIGWMYQTRHKKDVVGKVNYTVWSEVFSCPECGAEIVFYDHGFDQKTQKLREVIVCPKCAASLTKDVMELAYETKFDTAIGQTVKLPRRIPVLVNYSVGKTKYEKAPDGDDLELYERIAALPLPTIVPTATLPDMQMMRVGRMQPSGIKRFHQFFLPRGAHALAALWDSALKSPEGRVRHAALFFVEQAIWGMSVLARYVPTHYSQVNQYLSGVFYVASQIVDPSPEYILGGKAKRLRSAFSESAKCRNTSIIATQDSGTIAIPNDSVDYIFVDPPFGENIYYSDLNILIETWHRVLTNSTPEAIVDRVKGKGLPEYQSLMKKCFAEFYRVLKPGRWLTVEFSNSQAAVWNAIQSTLQEAGFVVSTVAALDKQQRTFQSITSPTAVKQDLVISAYKPNGGLEDRFMKNSSKPEAIWDFVETHLKNLPVTKAKGGQLQMITERDPRILFDRAVAFYVSHSVPVPVSSAEFQAALGDKFVERDGMWFLPEQVNEYDKKRAQMESVGQLAIFVEDERSAIDWLRVELKDKPQTYQDLQPNFMQQLNASWKKWEARPELKVLLDQNFLCYDGTGEVPSQIHSYLSTQFKELRNLPKDHAQLRQKAKDRWYVPDPKKNVDVETLRNKRLLEEFWSYLPDGYISAARSPDRNPTLPMPGMTSPRPKVPRSKKLKQVRTEAVRVGFKFCYQQKDYPTILAVADMLPESVLNEDEQLQMIYDNAALRAEAAG